MLVRRSLHQTELPQTVGACRADIGANEDVIDYGRHLDYVAIQLVVPPPVVRSGCLWLLPGSFGELLLGPDPRGIQFERLLEFLACIGIPARLSQREAQPQMRIGRARIERNGL